MSNDYYNHSSWPATGAPGTSAPARSELNNITAGFNKLPALTGNAGKAVVVNGVGTALSTTTGTLTLAGNFATSGAYALTLTVTGATNVTLPTTGTLATLTGTEEFANKTLNAAVAKGTWTASGTWTLPAFTAGGLITATASAALSNSDGTAVLGLDTTNASSRGAALTLAQNGTVRGALAVSGWVLGTTASDVVLYANSGKNIYLWADGGTSTGLQVNSTGAAVTGVLSATKNANAEQSLTLTNTTAGTASAVRIDLVSDAAAGQLTLFANSSLASGTTFGVAAAKLKAIFDNSTLASTSGLLIGTAANVPLYLAVNAGVIATISSTGLAVTGALSASGTLTVSTAGGNVSWGGGTAITTLKQTNLDSNPTGYASFSRVGDWVTVCGYAVCDPTAAGTIEFRLVPPGPSTTFTGPTEAFGVVTGGSTAYGSLYSDAVNNRVIVSASASSGAAFTVYFSFQYKVL